MLKDLQTEVHLSSDQLEIIDIAASSLGISRSAFIVRASLECAQQVNLDRILFDVTTDQFEAFEKILNNPEHSYSAGYKLLMSRKPVWNTDQ